VDKGLEERIRIEKKQRKGNTHWKRARPQAMPFEIRKTVFFVCPVCGEEYPLPDPPTQKTTLQCIRDSCSGREVFVDPSGGRRLLENSSATFHETDPPPLSRSGSPEPTGGGRAKQRVSITIGSAIIINLALITMIVVILYLVPMIVYRCSEGERPKELSGVVSTDPAAESRFP
jgi:hypothetical protein